MSSSNCCYLTCIQISQDTGNLDWYSHPLKNFPQFIVIHTAKVFSTVNEAEVDVFLNYLAFTMTQWMLVIWSLVSLLLWNPAFISGSSGFTYCWSLAWKILNITLLACEMIPTAIWKFFCIAILWDWTDSWPFGVLCPLLCFPNLVIYWVQHF